TRDLLPLGSPGAMDLLYAFDDRIQTSTVEPASIAPVARLLGADTIWLSNDIAFDRFRTARPELLAGLFEAGVAGIGSITSYGTPVPNVPQVPMIDETALSQRAVGEALPPVQLAAVKDPVPMIRASSRLVVLAGSGDGVVDAAASGLLHGDEAVIYAADVRPSDDLAAAGLVVVTDSNRDRAHLWNGSQDVVGFTESGGANGGVLRHSDSDQRLPVFPAGTVAQQTTATLETGMVVRASAYGEPFAYRPEQRPAMAVDGDPDTAWVVADRADPVGEYLEVSPIDGHLTLLQPQHTNANRMITAIRISSISGAGAPIDVVLGQASLVSPGQQVDGLPTGKVRITITAVGLRSGGTDSGPSAVGFAELGVGPNREVVHVPTTALGKGPTATPMAIVLTRLRTDPLDRWRSDPEPTLVRQFDLPTARTVQPSITLRVDHRAADSVLATLTGHSETIANRRLTGDTAAAGWYATDGDPSTAWTSPFADVVGSSLTLRLDPDVPLGPLTVHQTIDQNHSIISNVTVTVASQSIPITVPPPDSSGASMLTLPALHGESMTLTITGIDARSTIDRRFGEPTILPVAITEIGGSGLAHTTAIPAGGSCRTDLVSVDGKPLGVTVTADDVKAMTAGAAVTVQPCDAATLQLEPGSHLVVGANGLRSGIDVDRVVLSEGTPAPATAGPTVTVQRTRTTRTATVAACPGGCWLIFGEGYNSGWTATAAGRSLGAPRQIAGGFNGWWLAPSSTATTVAIAWKAQGGLNLALTASAIGVLLCL
ncbi:MAG: hypothetical protein ABIQ39_03200, partial [Ilumatobacteraceae bacterium]